MRIFKYFQNNFLFIKIIHHFDPNVIRKNYAHSFKSNIVEINALNGMFYVDINDHLGYRFFINNGFDNFIIQLGDALGISKEDILLDIGANIGTTCVPFSISNGAEIIAIEASKLNASLLLRNAFANNIKLDVHVNCAVDKKIFNEKEWINMFHKDGNTGANSIFETWNPSVLDTTKEYVKTNTIDNIIGNVNLNRIKLIKLDVEGSESIVLRSSELLLELNIPIVFEYRSDLNTEENLNNNKELIEILEKNFFLYGIKSEKNIFTLIDFIKSNSYENAIAIPKKSKDEYLKKIKKYTA